MNMDIKVNNWSVIEKLEYKTVAVEKHPSGDGYGCLWEAFPSNTK